MVFSGKMELETLGKLLLGCAFLVIMIVLFIGVGNSIDKNEGSFGDFVCYASNLIKHNVLGSFPSGCMEGKSGTVYVNDKDNYKSEEQVAELIDRCWWMYGSGEWDLGSWEMGDTFSFKRVFGVVIPFDFTYNCYAFSLDKEMEVKELFDYMKDYKRNGREASDTTDSETYWNYIQKSSLGEGIGIDSNLGGKFEKNHVYYIIFLDERHSQALQGAYIYKDKILISDEKGFEDFLKPMNNKRIKRESEEFQKYLNEALNKNFDLNYGE